MADKLFNNIEDKAKIAVFRVKLKSATMFWKGKQFIGASLLLKEKQQENCFVQIYLLLQGIEVLLKGILIMEDYETTLHWKLKSDSSMTF